MKYKHIALSGVEVKFNDDKTATIEGYGSTFGNMDSYRDIVMPGAFKNSIVDKLPAMLYQHRSDRICGIWDTVQEDNKGLLLRGRTINTTLGQDTAEELRSGALKTMSIGYTTLKDRYDSTNNVRYLDELKLWEVSLVTFPANDKAVITDVKAALEDIDAAADIIGQAGGMLSQIIGGTLQASPELLSSIMHLMQSAGALLEEPDMEQDDADKSTPSTERELEKYLRDAGTSRKKAKAIAAGFKAVATQRDAGAGIDTLITLLNKF